MSTKLNNNTHLPVFAENVLDRADHLRGDIQLSQSNGRYLLIADNQVIMLKTAVELQQVEDEFSCFYHHELLPKALLASDCWVFLGKFNQALFFAIDVSGKLEDDLIAETVHIRAMAIEHRLKDEILGVLAQANSLLSWHANHRYCAKCGQMSVSAHGGWRRDCPSCHTQHFPRTDPVVIMLVTHNNRCLLGRGVNFAERRYSCLAGFMEPGETIAQAARRELFEEAGITGGEVTVLFDQPWPFPSNLMIGVHVEAQSEQISIDENELADAIWVDKQDIKAVFAGVEDPRFSLPPRLAVARDLLQHWIT